MSDGEGLALGKESVLGGLQVVVEKPSDNISTSSLDSDNVLELDGDFVEGFTGMKVSLLQVSVRNTSEKQVDLGNLDLQLTESSHFERGTAEKSDFTYQGETRTSFLRILAEGEQLEPDERISGLVAFSAPILTDPELGHVEIRQHGPNSEEPNIARWNLTGSEKGGGSVSRGKQEDSGKVNSDEQNTSGKYEDQMEICPSCGADLTEYSEPHYCPMCGESTSIIASSDEVAGRDDVQLNVCENCYENLAEYDDVKHCPHCGMRALDAEEKTEAAAILGKATFGEFSDLQSGELETIVELLNSADPEFRTYALHVMASHEYNKYDDEQRYGEIIQSALSILIDRLEEASFVDYLSGGESTTDQILEVNLVSIAISNVLDQTSYGRLRRLVWDEESITRLAETTRAKLSQLTDSDYSSSMLTESNQVNTEANLVTILSKIVQFDPSLIEPALEDVRDISQNRVLDDNLNLEESRKCPVCGLEKTPDHGAVVVYLAELVEPFAESRTSVVNTIVQTILSQLERPEGNWDDERKVKKITDVLATIVNSVPEPFAESTERLTDLAAYGRLPIKPQSTKIQGSSPLIRENVGEVLGTLVLKEKIDSSVLTQGIESADEVYVETMVMAINHVASEKPEFVDNTTSSLVDLVDSGCYYSIFVPAATAIRHLGVTSACKPLVEQYTNAEGYDLGANRRIRSNAGETLNELDCTNVIYQESSSISGDETLQCAHCGESLGKFNAPVFCPICGTELCSN